MLTSLPPSLSPSLIGYSISVMKKCVFAFALMFFCLCTFAAKPGLRFRADGSFKIVQFTDTHIRTTLPEEAAAVYALMDEIIDRERPDMVVLGGDNVTVNPCRPEIEKLVAFLDSKEVPWAAVFGNHDAQQELSRSEMSEIYASGKYSLNTLNDAGELADLEIPILDADSVAGFYVYCMDSHSYNSINGKECYDWFTQSQVQWMRECCAARTSVDGSVAPSLAFFHIPLCEYIDAWAPKENPREGASKGAPCTGIRGENICCPGFNSGMFDAMREGGSVVGMSVGHDHDNDFLAAYRGIALCYGRCSGYGSVYNHLPHGARVFVVREGLRGFETWIRETGGRVVRHCFTDGASLVNAPRDRSKPYGTWSELPELCVGARSDRGETLPAWQEGNLDIHFISTGSGNASFMVLPDATTMLVDAGDLKRPDSRAPERKPSCLRTVGEWIADYIWQFSPKGKETVLDYALVTHYHDDHIGFEGNARSNAPGGYPLSGITEVGTLIPIRKLVDRGRVENGFLNFYNDFVDFQCLEGGMVHETARVGSSSQFTLCRDREAYPDFNIRVLFSGGKIAAKKGERIGADKFKKGGEPNENNLSVGFRLEYGKFSFYSGGDISGVGHTGGTDPKGMEALVAGLVGPVDVAVMNHHGNRDTQSAEFCAALQPRVWIGECWGVRHPGEEVIRRISSRYVYPGPRDIYTTYMAPETRTFMGRYLSDYKSLSGHIVVRVAPGGDSFDVYVLDDSSTDRGVVSVNHYAL